MLKIRKNQMITFEKHAFSNFKEEMVRHIQHITPHHAEIIGRNAIRQVVKKGLEKAGLYGFTNQGPVRFYVELMFMLGSDFDTDPQYRWAKDILIDSAIGDQMRRADRLHDKLMDYLGKVTGLSNEIEHGSLMKLSQICLDELPVSTNEIRLLLQRSYPQKCEYMGEPALSTLIQYGTVLSNEHIGAAAAAGPAVFVSLIFTCGHGCVTDPQFPWAETILRDSTIEDKNEKLTLLFLKKKEHIHNVLLR